MLISRLLAVPSLRPRYLGHVKDMATTWLDADVRLDTRKLDSNDAFRAMVEQYREIMGTRAPVMRIGLKNFADQRRAFLLAYPAIRDLR